MKKFFVFSFLLVALLAIPMIASAQSFKDAWITVSADVGTPVIGMTVNSSNYLNVYHPATNPDSTPLLGDGTWVDGILNVTVGYTPFQTALPALKIGGMVRISGALGFCNQSLTVALGDGFNVTYNDSWLGITPMLAGRYQLGKDSYLNVGMGPSFWAYTSLSANATEYTSYVPVSGTAFPVGGNLTYCFQFMSETMGVSLAALTSLSFGINTIELGFTGPDVYLGYGISF